MPRPQAIKARVVGSGTGRTVEREGVETLKFCRVALLAEVMPLTCALMLNCARARPGMIKARLAAKTKYRFIMFEMLKTASCRSKRLNRHPSAPVLAKNLSAAFFRP